MQDVITKEIVVKASQKDVYDAITNPAKIVMWFPNEIDGTLEADTLSTLKFTKQNHKAPIYVEAATPFSYFSYRWVPSTTTLEGDPRNVPHTLVEFFIEELAEGTKVTVKESGFSTLPTEIAEKMFNQNSGGWEFMIGRLEKIMNHD
jgi:uncharacterized protein YndB with AHSA1/START domain